MSNKEQSHQGKERLAAFTIDLLLLWIISLLADGALAGLPDLWRFLSLPLLFLLYRLVMHVAFGRTLGKIVWRLRVEALGGTRPGLFRVLRREALPGAAAVLLGLADWVRLDVFLSSNGRLAGGSWLYALGAVLLAADILAVFFNKKRRALHDIIAGTAVMADQSSH